MTLSHTDQQWPTSGLSYGGDYNPEQWDRKTWQEDMRLMREAGVNLVSLGIFSWGWVEVADGQFHWDSMDEIMDLLQENGIGVDLATPSAAPPAWLLHDHPEILPVDQDMQQVWPGAGWAGAPAVRCSVATPGASHESLLNGTDRAITCACGTWATSSAAATGTATARSRPRPSAPGSLTGTAAWRESTRLGERLSGAIS